MSYLDYLRRAEATANPMAGLLRRLLNPNVESPTRPAVAPTTPAPTDVTMGPTYPEAGIRQGSDQYGPEMRVARSPVVTPGQASSPAVAPPAADEGPALNPAAQAMIDRMRQGRAENEQAGEGPGDQPEDPRSRLAQFGFAMAASRNPSLFGQIGEAGLAMMQGDRQQRQDDTRSRELDIMQEYRRAQIELAQAERQWERDPSNPLNIARLAQARAAEMRLRGGGGSGGSGSDRIAGQVIGDDGILYGMTRDGRVVPYRTPEGQPFRRGETERFQTQWNSMRNAALARMSELTSPESRLPPAERERLANEEANRGVAALRNALGRPGQPAGGSAAPAAPADTREPQRIRIPYTP